MTGPTSGHCGVAQQSGLAIAGEDTAFDANDGGDVRIPAGAGELVGRRQTVTLRLSSRLRPRSWLQADRSGAVAVVIC